MSKADLQKEREQLLADINIASGSIKNLLDQNIVDEIQVLQLDEAYSVLKRGIDRAKERVAEIDRELATPDPLVCQYCGKEVPWSEIELYLPITPAMFLCDECIANGEEI